MKGRSWVVVLEGGWAGCKTQSRASGRLAGTVGSQGVAAAGWRMKARLWFHAASRSQHDVDGDGGRASACEYVSSKVGMSYARRL